MGRTKAERHFPWRAIAVVLALALVCYCLTSGPDFGAKGFLLFLLGLSIISPVIVFSMSVGGLRRRWLTRIALDKNANRKRWEFFDRVWSVLQGASDGHKVVKVWLSCIFIIEMLLIAFILFIVIVDVVVEKVLPPEAKRAILSANR